MIKTMRKGRAVKVESEEYVEDVSGRKILVDKRVIRYDRV